MTRAVVVGLVLVALASLAIQRPPFVSREILEARARWRAGDVGAARSIAAATLPRLRHQVAKSPADPDRHMALAEALALVGRSREALSEARTALATDTASPPSVGTSREGAPLVETMVIVAMEAGANDAALDAIEILLARGPRPGAPSVAEDERFAPLRADPRFMHLLSLYGAPPDPTL